MVSDSKSSKLYGALDAAGRLQTNSDDDDVVVGSIISLQAVQDALEKEVQKFEELRVYISLSDSYCTFPASAKDSAFHDPTISEYNLFSGLHIDGKEQNGIQPRAVQLTKLDGEVHMLKSKLEEVSVMIKAKEHQIIELESILNGSNLLQEASMSTSHSLEEECREMEIELEVLFKRKIEFEVEYLVISKMTQSLSVTAEDQYSLFEEQKSLAGEQIQMLHKLKDAEHKAVVLKNQSEELAASCEQLLAAEEVLKTRNKLYKHTLYFAAQILLLVVVILIFILRPRTYGVVPT